MHVSRSSWRRSRSNFSTSLAKIESLEQRQLLTSVVVNSAIDAIYPAGSGLVSLRNAIITANDSTSPTTITFDPTAFATAKSIVLSGTELEFSNLSEPTTITGPSAGVTISGNDLSEVLAVDSDVSVTASRVTVEDGSRYGVTIADSGLLTLANSTVTANQGEGINSEGTLTLTDVSISANTQGGIDAEGTAKLTNVTVANNSSSDGGAGIFNQGTMTMTDVTISGNTALGNGAGIYNRDTVTLVDSTISGNTDKGSAGGGFYNYQYGTATLTNVTIAANVLTSKYAGGAGIDNRATATKFSITNSIVAGNTSAGVSPDVEGPFNSLGFNLAGAVDGSTGFNAADLTGTAAKPLNAKLGALANNGGFTETMLPLAGSPAIGAGLAGFVPSGITTDQRGLPRIVGGKVDIGAVEVQSAVTTTITAVAPVAQTASVGVSKSFTLGSFTETNATGPYTVTVSWGDGTANTTFTDTTVGTLAAQTHTFTTSGSKTVTVSVKDSASHISNTATFGVTVSAAVAASISGTVFSDSNANGILDTGEKGLAGVVVYIDANKNGVLDTGEIKTTTSSAGTYTFTGLAAGTYQIREVVPAGYKLITPTAGDFSVTVTTAAVTGELFADAPATASISGKVFDDANANGKRDVGEDGLGLWTVYLDLNNNGKLDTTDVSIVTDISGNFTFAGLTAGTYTVRIVPLTGDTTTTPGGTIETIKLTVGQTDTGVLFGERSTT